MTLNELKILLALNGNERIEYAETDIFADEELYTVYLESVCSKHTWYIHYNKGGDGDLAWLACKYAGKVIKGRWRVAEAVIMHSPLWSYHYADDIIKGRWLEGEAVIATDPEWAFYYARDVIRGRFVDAESAIMCSPMWACQYARHVINRRWPEAESVIATNAEDAFEYARYVIKGKFVEAEGTIATDRFYTEWYNREFGTSI